MRVRIAGERVLGHCEGACLAIVKARARARLAPACGACRYPRCPERRSLPEAHRGAKTTLLVQGGIGASGPSCSQAGGGHS
eukprot:6201371-Pleurochrysis_carterae.AAC.1